MDPGFTVDVLGVERLVAYVVREHRRGRPLREILDDSYIARRSSTARLCRLLDRPDVIRAVARDTGAAKHATAGPRSSASPDEARRSVETPAA